MLTYKNEAHFSASLVKAMRAKGWFVQRIESGETGKGIPDIYAISPNKVAHWFELKRERRAIKEVEVISWRPGQQSWLNDVTRRGQNATTLACFNDGILLIPHDRIYTENTVLASQCGFARDIRELLK